MSTSQEPAGMEVSSHRACAHCRSQKVRCIMDEENSDVCQRCARSGRPCVFTPLQKRKQRKRTDTRVAELEREMRAMRAMLRNKDQAKGQQNPKNNPPQPLPAGLWYAENSAQAPRRSDEGAVAGPVRPENGDSRLPLERPGQVQRDPPTLWPRRFADKPFNSGKDIVDSGMVSMATARQLFELYRKDLFPHYPMVVIPDSTSADELRQTKPALFLAIIAAAAGAESSELSARLDQEVLHMYATKSLIHSEKSIELVQALLVSAVWYHPPNKFGQLKYYEYIHMAATMAMDIGIGTRPVVHRSRFGPNRGIREGRKPNIHPLEDAANPDLSMTPRSREPSPDTGSVESRRTFLACYVICSGVSMSLRRPNMLRVSSHIRECVDYLERSPNAVPSDRTLLAWVKLIMIAEEISNSLAYDDPGGIASISELRTQLMLKDFNKRLESWYTGIPEADMNSSLVMMYQTIRIFLHEVALHVDHSPEDFRAPYQMGGIHPSDGEEIPTQALAEAIAECINAAHSLLNTFLAMDVNKARSLPVFSYVRISYSAFVLAKLSLSVANPASRIGKVLDRSSLKVESFMDRAILHVRVVVGPQRSRVPGIFLALLFKLRQWCMHPEIIDGSEEAMNAPALDPGQTATTQEIEGTQSRTDRRIEGPRVVEHVSGDESSPQTPSDGQGGGNESIAEKLSPDSVPRISSEFTPPSHQVDYKGAPVGGVPATNMISNEAASVAGITIPQPTPFLNPTDQMELDQNFFQFFGDMNALPYAGLGELDDWTSIPTDLMGLPDNFNWQATSNIDATTML